MGTKSSEKETASEEKFSSGCLELPSHAVGGIQVEQNFSTAAGGLRSYYLSLPTNYDPSLPHRVIVGFSGTNWVGSQIQPYLDLEDGTAQEIFVYPDPLVRTFDNWGEYGGWLLGEYAYPAHGSEDLNFVSELLDSLKTQYCIDPEKIFVTGHSWGGDMAQVVSCFLGDSVRASVPVAANFPYWFMDESNQRISCVGDTAVWTMFGIADDHFTAQPYPGSYGDECRDFWLQERGCAESYTELVLGNDTCEIYDGCSSPVQYCLYGAEHAHQIPSDYYAEETMKFFRSFP